MCAARFRSRCEANGATQEDLFQLAGIGFLKAVRGFDLSRGLCFSTYAVPKIVGEIRRFLRDDGPIKVSRKLKTDYARLEANRSSLVGELGRMPTLGELASRMDCTPEEVAWMEQSVPKITDGEGDNALLERIPATENQEEKILEHLALTESVKQLPPREKAILRLRYGRGLTQQQTAALLQTSQAQVSRIERAALVQLRQWLTEAPNVT